MKADISKIKECSQKHTNFMIDKHVQYVWFYENMLDPEINHSECIDCGLMSDV